MLEVRLIPADDVHQALTDWDTERIEMMDRSRFGLLTMNGEYSRRRLTVHPGVVVRLADVLPRIVDGGAIYQQVTFILYLQPATRRCSSQRRDGGIE